MFEIKIHATGSKGNAYTIQDGAQKILIDPGIRFKLLQQKTNYTLSKYDFVMLSHEHKDHCQSIPNLLRMGINCYMSRATRDYLGIMNSSALIIADRMVFERDGWRILPFAVEHDAMEPLGFLIESPSGKKILYATDTCYIKYLFSGVTHYLVECNYSEDLLQKNVALDDGIKRRIRTSHFEFENVKEFFRQQDLSKTERIYLIHLSDDNSDEKLFTEVVQGITGVPVFIG